MTKANFGFMGLGVMGHMLALNVERNGFHFAGYDRDARKVKAFGEKYPGKNLIPSATLEEFLTTLERPRRIMMMIQAGKPVDEMLDTFAITGTTDDVVDKIRGRYEGVADRLYLYNVFTSPYASDDGRLREVISALRA